VSAIAVGIQTRRLTALPSTSDLSRVDEKRFQTEEAEHATGNSGGERVKAKD
jgi:hypothetical protein